MTYLIVTNYKTIPDAVLPVVITAITRNAIPLKQQVNYTLVDLYRIYLKISLHVTRGDDHKTVYKTILTNLTMASNLNNTIN